MEPQTRISVRDMLSYNFLSQPHYSPDGKRLAVRLHVPQFDDNRYATDLWISAKEADGLRRLTSCGRVGVWSWEDDRHILFSSDRDPADQKKREDGEQFTQFYRIDLAGGEAWPAFRVDLAVQDLRVLPDERILLRGTATPVTEEERKARKDAAVTIINEAPMWSNGGGFTSDTRSALFLRDEEGQVRRVSPENRSVDVFELSEADDTVLYAGVTYYGKRPVWNELYAYSVSRGETAAVRETDSDSEQLRALQFDNIGFAGPGRAVVTINRMAEYGLNENPDFAVVDLESRSFRFITHGLDRSVGNSVGSDCRFGGGPAPLRYFDGAVYFVTTEELSSGIRRLNVENGDVTDAYVPAGSVDGFDVNAAGETVVIELRGDALQELYRVSLSGSAEATRRLSSFNVENLVTKRIATPEPLTVSREDGAEIQGYVLAPPNHAGKRPGILAIHGGPKTIYGSVFVHEMQTLAHAGYYVFFCNPRGSDGRGNAFADIRGRYGTIDFEDLMAFTDGVMHRYADRIDAERLGVMGGSYGGFMTNWIVGSTSRFAAAVSQRSISSWLSMWGTSDIGYYFTEDQIAGDPWEGREALWRQSPLRLAQQVRTPLLLIHSRQDYRCWEVEAFQFFTAIRYNGGEARVALFDGESHELSRSGKPKPRMRRLEEILAWFEERLATEHDSY